MAQIKNVTELDFDQIKTNLKVFLSAQEKFNDYDFDGAGLNVLLDILAYNTQYNALLAHMTTNETFLDSAQIRSNAVSHAKNLGYIPKSRVGATAKLKVTVTGDANSPAILTIPKGFSFTGQIGSNSYTFVTNGSYNATKNSFNNQYIFSSVEAKEGKLVNFTYRVDNSQELQKFRVADLNIDTSTILVKVRESLTSSDNTTYTLYDNLLNVNSNSNVYYLQENMNGQYEFYFGDNILGNKPTTGQIVELTYISTNGLEGNGAKSFSANSAIGGFTSISVELATGFTKTADGADKETIDSIKFNAPKLFAAQNRAVTSEDYKTILNATYDFIQDISVWGGEVNDPPLYGKVFISINPIDADFLTDSTKSGISTFLSNKNVGSVTTEIVDPDYTYITGTVLFKYNPNETNRTKTQLESAVRQAITDYNTTKLGKFDGVLRYSELLRTIDSVDTGILNSFARLEMHKHVTPVTNIASNYTVKFSSPIYITEESEPTLRSDNFTVNQTSVTLSDISAGDGTNNRTVQLLSVATGDVINANIGTLYPEKGLLEISNINITSTSTIFVYASPDSYDIAPKFNQLVTIELDETPGITITGEEDTISILGSSGAATYQTFSRHN